MAAMATPQVDQPGAAPLSTGSADLARSVRRLAARWHRSRAAWQIGIGIALLATSGLLLLRALGIWLGDAVVWPAFVAAAGAVLIWRQSLRSTPVEERPAPRPLAPVA